MYLKLHFPIIFHLIQIYIHISINILGKHI